ncbi:MAG: ABC transporter permease [Oscillospiraceae bacterium]|nr:ABC transporter permease [Oscillospiraceae bacterium]
MKLAVLYSTMVLQMKKSFVRPMFRFCLLANPILNTILLYEMFRTAGEESFLAYVVLGAGLMGLWSCICFSSAGDINRERYSGTLALIFATPASFPLIILGKIIGNTLLSLLSLLISLVTAVLLFRVPLSIGSPLLFLAALAGTVTCFVVISSVIACLLTLSRKTELYMNCLEIPIILLCGFVFPVSILPPAVQALSRALSPTYAIELLRMSLYGVTDLRLFWEKFGIMLAITALYAILSGLLYRRIDRRVRIAATLEVA